MAVPDYQSLMLPILMLTGDGKPHKLSKAMVQIADALGLSDQDREEMLPSGTMTRFYNRFGWAATYLYKAELIDKPNRGWFQITDRGTKLLSQNPDAINLNLLLQYPEFAEFRNKKKGTKSEVVPAQIETDTPEDLIDQAISEIDISLTDEIQKKLASVDPFRFEQIVVDLLVAMGYGGSMSDAAQVIGKPGDEGIDGTIKEDSLGLDVVYVQAKRWKDTVGRKEIQSFAGSLEGKRATKGVFITTSGYSKGAIDYVNTISKRIVLIDGDRLSQLMIDYGIGVTTVREITLSKLDMDYFDEL